jgi:hypothetical protein
MFYSPEIYCPVSFSNVDNIFPELPKRYNTNTHEYSLFHETFCKRIDNLSGEGDIIEFGVCSGNSIVEIAKYNPTKKIFGFDHFQGLEKTKQSIPEYAGWHEGAFKVCNTNEDWVPKSIDEVIQRCSEFSNIEIIVEDVHQLKSPDSYGIGKIGAVHMDLDIYEPTVSALKFINKCNWGEIYFRFDDWHGHEPDYDNHERKAFKEWLDFNNFKYEIYEDGLCSGVKVWKSS